MFQSWCSPETWDDGVPFQRLEQGYGSAPPSHFGEYMAFVDPIGITLSQKGMDQEGDLPAYGGHR